jgi:sec-independent protein translocase protein TatA
MFPLLPLFPGVPGGLELAVILLIAILLFGANKLPKLARSTGQAMGEFRRGREEIERELAETAGTARADETDADVDVDAERA